MDMESKIHISPEEWAQKRREDEAAKKSNLQRALRAIRGMTSDEDIHVLITNALENNP